MIYLVNETSSDGVCMSIPFWNDVTILHLTTNMRLLADAPAITEVNRS